MQRQVTFTEGVDGEGNKLFMASQQCIIAGYGATEAEALAHLDENRATLEALSDPQKYLHGNN